MGGFWDEMDKELGLAPKDEPKPAEKQSDQAPMTVADLPQDDGLEPEQPEDPDKETDPFAALIDGMLTAEGVDVKTELRRKYDPLQGDLQQHDWKSMRERLFSGEDYEFRCRRCFKWVKSREVEGEEDNIYVTLEREDHVEDTSVTVMEDVEEEQLDAQGNPVLDQNGDPVMVKKQVPVHPMKKMKVKYHPKLKRYQTFEEAMAEQGVDPRCSEQIAKDVMTE